MPSVLRELSTSRVLVMEFETGLHVADSEVLVALGLAMVMMMSMIVVMIVKMTLIIMIMIVGMIIIVVMVLIVIVICGDDHQRHSGGDVGNSNHDEAIEALGLCPGDVANLLSAVIMMGWWWHDGMVVA